jgi:hypothetical protein
VGTRGGLRVLAGEKEDGRLDAGRQLDGEHCRGLANYSPAFKALLVILTACPLSLGHNAEWIIAMLRGGDVAGARPSRRQIRLT